MAPKSAASSVVAPEAPSIGRDSPDRFINRELSWLDFNHRVVEEAENPRHPLLERLRFVSISASNLDEFYSVRVAGLIGQAKAGVTAVSPDGRTPAQQLAEIKIRAEALLAEQQRVWRELRGLLREAGIEVVRARRAVATTTCDWLDALVHGAGVPGADAARDRPGASVPVHPQHGPGDGAAAAARGGRRRACGRCCRCRARSSGSSGCRRASRASRSGSCCWRTWSALFLDRLFPGFRVTGQGMFRLIRDTDVEFEEEAEDLVRSYETALKRRRRGRGDPSRHRRRHAGGTARAGRRRDWTPTPDETHVDRRHARRGRPAAADRRRPARPAVPALHAALSRAHPRLRRRLLRRDPRQGHHRPPSVRELRRGGAVPAPGGAATRA